MAIITESIDAVSNTGTGYTIGGGDEFRGTLETTRSVDWIRSVLSDDKGYYWSLTGDGSANSLSSLKLYLLNDDGSQLGNGSGSIAYTPSQGGEFFVQVGHSNPTTGSSGNYRLRLTEEIANNIKTTETLSSGETRASRSEYRNDRDWYAVTLESDQSYYWTMSGDGSGDAVSRFGLTLMDADGTQVDSGDSLMAYTPATSGTYYVQTGGTSLRSGQVGNYLIRMDAEVADNDQTRAGISDGEVITGRAEYGSDRDWYEVTLSSDQSYYWTMSGDGSSDAVTDFDLTLYNANGAEVTDGRSSLVFTPTADGTYYIQTGNIYPSAARTGIYELSMTAELTANADTEGRIAAGETQRGRSEYNTDRDWHQTELQTGYSYYWTLAGDGSGDSLSNFALTLFNASGTEQADGRNLLTYTPADAGTYYVQTGQGSPYSSNYDGNYELGMVRETSNGFGTLARIAVNETVRDTLDYRLDKDMYRTELAAGRTYDITMTGDGGIQSLDRASVSIFAGNGTFLDRETAYSSDVTLTFTTTEADTYFIYAGDQVGFTSASRHGFGSYELSVGKGTLTGTAGNDRLVSNDDAEILRGLDGNDTLIGNGGDDEIYGGETAADLRDVIFGGDGNDTIDGGYGNDELRGDAGDDVISGGFGGDTVIGGTGNDTITGSALGDVLFGSDGDDFINGGFGYDQINGGNGADAFFHLGIFDHGSDWVQDYSAREGDVLVFGRAGATAAQFQINYAAKANAGEADVAEAFVIYKPTGQIMWALIDGAGQDEINLQIGGDVFDLAA